MSVVNTLSDLITLCDAVPAQVVPSYQHKGIVRLSRAYASVAVGDDDGSVYRMVRVPSNAAFFCMNILNDAINGGVAYHLGVYQTAANGGAVVDNDLFASSVDFSSARYLPFDVMLEAGISLATRKKRLWELLGLSQDSHREYDLCFYAATAGIGSGDILLECLWSQ